MVVPLLTMCLAGGQLTYQPHSLLLKASSGVSGNIHQRHRMLYGVFREVKARQSSSSLYSENKTQSCAETQCRKARAQHKRQISLWLLYILICCRRMSNASWKTNLHIYLVNSFDCGLHSRCLEHGFELGPVRGCILSSTSVAWTCSYPAKLKHSCSFQLLLVEILGRPSFVNNLLLSCPLHFTKAYSQLTKT